MVPAWPSIRDTSVQKPSRAILKVERYSFLAYLSRLSATAVLWSSSPDANPLSGRYFPWPSTKPQDKRSTMLVSTSLFGCLWCWVATCWVLEMQKPRGNLKVLVEHTLWHHDISPLYLFFFFFGRTFLKAIPGAERTLGWHCAPPLTVVS